MKFKRKDDAKRPDKNKKMLISFSVVSVIVLFINIIAITVCSFFKEIDYVYDALSISSLIIAFLSLMSSVFFSMGIYRQSERQNEINDTLFKKDDVYITNNYSLIDIGNRITTFDSDDSIDYANVLKQNESNNYFRFVMKVSDYINKPMYKADIYSVIAKDKNNEVLLDISSEKPVTTDYASNILDRGYNCVSFDIGLKDCDIGDILAHTDKLYITMDITSIFNVIFTVMFTIKLDGEKISSPNVIDEDAQKYNNLRRFIKHSSVFKIINKQIDQD